MKQSAGGRSTSSTNEAPTKHQTYWGAAGQLEWSEWIYISSKGPLPLLDGISMCSNNPHAKACAMKQSAGGRSTSSTNEAPTKHQTCWWAACQLEWSEWTYIGSPRPLPLLGGISERPSVPHAKACAMKQSACGRSTSSTNDAPTKHQTYWWAAGQLEWSEWIYISSPRPLPLLDGI